MSLPTPYWQSEDGRATLYCGDCLELLPLMESGSVDAVVTDPPYGLGELWNGGGGSSESTWKFNPDEAKEWDGAIVPAVEMLPAYCDEVVIWGGNYYRLPPSRCWFVWDKKQPDNWTTGQCELAWTNLSRPVRAFRMCQAVAHDEMRPKLHPTQKPLSLMRWCMKWLGGQTILDPFAGSGTTGVACIQTGRKFVGIELSEKYCAIAACRLAAAYCEDGGLFDPKAKHRASLFEGAAP